MTSQVAMAQWIRRLPTEQEIPGSSPGSDCLFFGLFSVGCSVDGVLNVQCKISRSSSLVVMTSALHAEGRGFNPHLEYDYFFVTLTYTANLHRLS